MRDKGLIVVVARLMTVVTAVQINAIWLVH